MTQRISYISQKQNVPRHKRSSLRLSPPTKWIGKRHEYSCTPCKLKTLDESTLLTYPFRSFTFLCHFLAKIGLNECLEGKFISKSLLPLAHNLLLPLQGSIARRESRDQLQLTNHSTVLKSLTNWALHPTAACHQAWKQCCLGPVLGSKLTFIFAKWNSINKLFVSATLWGTLSKDQSLRLHGNTLEGSKPTSVTSSHCYS